MAIGSFALCLSVAHAEPRQWLADRGLTYGLVLNSEALANIDGGLKRGALFHGKLEVTLGADFGKLLGVAAPTFFANAFFIHGDGNISTELVDAFDTISNIAAPAALLLSELWLEQSIFGGAVSLRVGQYSADAEFFISDVSVVFLNSGWPTILALNLPGAGPNYPFSTPGLRLKAVPVPSLTVLVALLHGDPTLGNSAHGPPFRPRGPPLLLAEAIYRHHQEKVGLAGTLRLGGWHHFGSFPSLRFDRDGLPLAYPFSSGEPRQISGTSGLYAIIDQQLFRPPGGDKDSGISAFARVSAAPGEQNPISFYADGGLVLAGLVPHRPDDRIGATVLFARISGALRGHDRDRWRYTGVAGQQHAFESTLTVQYLAQLVAGWTLQGEVQYVINPGGHTSDPNATVLALRSTITY